MTATITTSNAISHQGKPLCSDTGVADGVGVGVGVGVEVGVGVIVAVPVPLVELLAAGPGVGVIVAVTPLFDEPPLFGVGVGVGVGGCRISYSQVNLYTTLIVLCDAGLPCMTVVICRHRNARTICDVGSQLVEPITIRSGLRTTRGYCHPSNMRSINSHIPVNR